MKQWYESLFEHYGRKYDNESFAQGTIGECDFIEKELRFNTSNKIIDIGCGAGRHTIELSKRGYNVTGIDLSESLLERAKEKAAEQNLHIEFLKYDARRLPFKNEFDAAIMLCEGAFPLMETDEMNYEILKNVSHALTPHGTLIFTTLNGLFPLCNSVEKFCNETTSEGNAAYKNNKFDVMTFRDFNITTVEDDFGQIKELECNERYYIPPEITWLLKSVGFRTIDMYGARLGAFSRNDKLTKDDFEMLVIAKK
jgi:2-polyprenyl-3-methyl-5-hydroxy-6-metoxy-1,4-benzoquinol methylase